MVTRITETQAALDHTHYIQTMQAGERALLYKFIITPNTKNGNGKGKAGKQETPTMRMQVQWNSNQKKGKGEFSSIATGDPTIGVTVDQAIDALNSAMAQVIPNKVRQAAEPAANRQEARIRSSPPHGISGQNSHSERFQHPDSKATGARVDVENIRGHNLKE